MRIVVLGGTGFIGSHIVQRLLSSGYNVTVFHRGNGGKLPSGVQVICGDRNCLDQYRGDFLGIRPEVVIDAIAFTQHQAELLTATFRGIAERTIVLSSGDVYRANDILFRRVPGDIEPTPSIESSPLRDQFFPYRGKPISKPYGFDWDDYDKILVERAVLENTDLPGTILRLPMVYGPGTREPAQQRFFAYLKRMDDRRPAILLDERTARWRAPWGYIGDIAEAVRLAIEDDRAASEIYNVGEADLLDMHGWIRELAAVAGWNGELVVKDQPCPPPNLPREMNLDQHLTMDTTKIRRELAYQETLPRHEALAQTVYWDREHSPNELDPAQFDYSLEDAILNSV
jgi:nucleoside-diphosphate-sugar epimerase